MKEHADYGDIFGEHFSTLKYMRTSPAHYYFRHKHPPVETPAMLIGRAIHCLTLEPQKFPASFSVYEGRRQGNVWKEFQAAAVADDKSIITETEHDNCLEVVDAVMAHDEARKLIESALEVEKTLQWQNRETGLHIKGSVDLVSDVRGDILLTDLKTTADISPWIFSSHCWRMGYFMQAAMYQEGYLEQQQPGIVAAMNIIAVEQKPPHDCAVYALDVASVAAGWDTYIRCLERVQECTLSGEWPGQMPDRGVLAAPAWALEQTEKEITLGGEAMTI